MRGRRKLLVWIGLGAIAPALPLFAQQGKIARIGILSARSRPTPSNPDLFFGELVRGLRDLGYVEGRNLHIEWRYADGRYERLPALAAELAKANVEVVVTHNTPGTHAMLRASKVLPIVMTTVADPVGSGFAASLARPGGNITGMALITGDFIPKYLELLALVVPSLSRAAVLVHPGNASHPRMLKSVEAAAQSKGVQLLPMQAGSPEEIERAFAAMARENLKTLMILTDTYFTVQRKQIADLALKHGVAAIHSGRESVMAGLLMSYGTNSADNYRRAAAYVDKILKGAKPGDLPIEQPDKFHLAVNRSTAKALGLRIPQELIGRADELID